MYFGSPSQVIDTEVFASVPEKYRFATSSKDRIGDILHRGAIQIYQCQFDIAVLSALTTLLAGYTFCQTRTRGRSKSCTSKFA